MNSRGETLTERVRWPVVLLGVAIAGVFATATLVLSDPPPGVRDTAANPADSLVAAWTAASGGAPVFDSLQSVFLSVTRIRYDTLTGRATDVASQDVRVRWRNGLPAVRIDHAAGHALVLGFDGHTAWAVQNNRAVPISSPVHQEALRATHEILRWVELPYALRDTTSVGLTYRGPASRSEGSRFNEEGRGSTGPEQAEVHSVTVARPTQAGVPSEFTYHFNLGDRFPFEVTYSDRGRPVREVLGPVERAAAMAYFARRDVFVGSGSRLETVLIEDFDLNPDVSEVSFEAPVE